MKRWTLLLVVLALAATTAGAGASQDKADDTAVLRGRIEQHFDLVPLTDGIALRPKERRGDMRLIEISEGVIAINGVPVSGRELRERAGSDADTILRLSYLGADQRRALFADPETRAGSRAEGRNGARQPPLPREGRHSRGERVRIFGDVLVEEDETIENQVVAVLGSVRVNGEVGQEVVAVLGSVDLGPKAVVRGDVVSVGGRVRRAPGAQIRGGMTEISIGGATRHLSVGPWFGPGDLDLGGFDGFPRLLGSAARLLLLVLLGGVALVVARGSVERSAERIAENPPKATLVGLTAGLLAAPVFVLTAFVLIITLIGIPLLLLLPFAAIWLILLALVGFTGTACVVGRAVRRKFGIGGEGAFLNVSIGFLALLSPLLIGRMLGIATWPDNPLSWLFVVGGTAVEFLAWATGFGAVLMNTFTRWRARRVARTAAPVPVA